MVRDAQPHLTPAVQLALHALVVVKGGFMRAAKPRQVFKNGLAERSFERLSVGMAPLPKQGAEPV